MAVFIITGADRLAMHHTIPTLCKDVGNISRHFLTFKYAFV